MDGPGSTSENAVSSEWISIADARLITDLSRQQVDNLIKGKKFPAAKNTAGHWRLEPSSVRAYAVGSRARKAKRKSRSALRDGHRPPAHFCAC